MIGTAFTVRDATVGDAAAIAAIYNHYIETSHSTFETVAVSADEMAGRVSAVNALTLPWLVTEANGDVVAFAYAGQWKTRQAYSYSVESTVYVAKGQERKGCGRALYQSLLQRLAARGIHLVIAGISLPNDSSIRLHEEFCFEFVGVFAEVGRKFDRWIDVGYWQLRLSNQWHDSDKSQ